MKVSDKEKLQIISNAYTNEINRIRRDYVDNNPDLKDLNEAEKEKLIENLKKGEQFTRPDTLYKGVLYGTYRVSR